MIDFELSKELKEAGYPQERQKYMPELDGINIYFEGNQEDPTGSFKIPTLSELIDACGERFYALTKARDGWMTQGFNNDEGDPANMIIKRSDTPEEAVARLWIALNKDKA